MLVADVKLTWKKSVTPGVTKQVLTTVIAGGSTTVELTPEIESYMVTISANTPFSFSVDTFGEDGLHTASETYSSSTDSLEAPQPATNLFHEVVGVRDDGSAPPSSAPRK